MLRFGLSGGNFLFSNQAGPGYIGAIGGSFVNTAPAGRADTFAHLNNSTGPLIRTPNLGGSYAGFIAGGAYYLGGIAANSPLITMLDNNIVIQCDVRINGTGQLFFTRNGTTIGTTSTYALTANSWFYLEFKALFSTSGSGTCEVRVNGITVATSTALTNAANAAGAAAVQFSQTLSGSSYMRDLYVVDTVGGVNTTYLGDVNIVELFDTGNGVNSQWTPNVGPLTLTSVNTTGVYQGTITGGATNAYVGYNFTITGFTNGANNLVSAKCIASSATSLSFTVTTITETHAGSAAFDCVVQAGINQTGTRPNGDVAYISDATAGEISDFVHQPLILPGGIILGIIHTSYMKKDGLGTKIAAQVCLSGATTEQGSNISLGNSYQYYTDVLEQDPNTSAQWALSGLNAATMGVKVIS